MLFKILFLIIHRENKVCIMSTNLINNYFANHNNVNLPTVTQTQQTYSARTTESNTLERVPGKDGIQCSKNKKRSLTKKILLAVSGTATAALATVYAIKKHQIKDIKNVQKTFQEVFMRDDITIEETKAMLKRYKEIEKIADKEEYIKALFEEAKKNYGFENSPIKLVIKKLPGKGGSCESTNERVVIGINSDIRDYLNYVHHELRHAKQHQYAYNLDPEYARNVFRKKYITKEEYHKISEDILDKLPKGDKRTPAELFKQVQEIADNKVTEKIEKTFGRLTPENIPEKYKPFAKEMKDGLQNYTKEDLIEYYFNPVEQDARKAGEAMKKVIRGKVILWPELSQDILCKHFPNLAKKLNAFFNKQGC